MISVKKLNGRRVISSDAKDVGEVGGAFVNLENWNITHLAVDLRDGAIDLFGFKKPITPFIGSVSVCLPISAVKIASDVITLNVEFEELPSLPIDKCKR